MKRAFQVWDKELKSMTQVILNILFLKEFIEIGKSQIFFEKLCYSDL